MGSIFRVLSKELFSLATLFFVIVPFVMANKDDYAARQHMNSLKDQTHYAMTSTFESAKNNYAFAAPNMRLSSGGGGAYVNGGPIYMPTH